MRPKRQYRSTGSDWKYDYNNNRNVFKESIAVCQSALLYAENKGGAKTFLFRCILESDVLV